jgi:hypothetical protein
MRRGVRVLEAPAQAFLHLLLVTIAPRGLPLRRHAGEGCGLLCVARESAGLRFLGVRIGVGEVEEQPAARSAFVARAHGALAPVAQQTRLPSVAVGEVGIPSAYQRSQRLCVVRDLARGTELVSALALGRYMSRNSTGFEA